MFQSTMRSVQKSEFRLLIPPRWWYESSQYTDDVVYCWMSTRFWLIASDNLYVENVSHVTHIISIRSGYLRLIKPFEHTLQSLWKWWNRLYSSILSTHSSVFRSMIFVSISFVKVWHELIFVIASIEFVSSSIHRIFVISLRSYDWRRHIKSIINRFSDVVSSLTRQSYNDLESVNSIIDREKIFKIRWMIDLMTESASNSCVIAYNSIVKTLLIILLHLIDDQWIIFALWSSVKQIT
jgi:hypothetical protein